MIKYEDGEKSTQVWSHEPIPVLTGLGVEQRTRYHRSR